MIEFISPRKRTRLGVSRSEEAHDRWRDTEHSRDDTEFVVVEFDEPRALGRGEDGGLVEYGGRRSHRRRGARPRPARRRSSRATLRRGSRASRGRTRSHAPVVSRSGSGARRSHAAESLIVYLVRSRERARRIGSCAWRELRRGRGACEKEGSEGSRTLRRRAARSPMRGRRRRGRAAGPRGSSA